MNEYIYMENIFYDADIIQLKIICSSEMIKIRSKIYVSGKLIDDLIFKINQFIEGDFVENLWQNEEIGNDTTACMSLKFLQKDKLGHVLIEVFLEIDDGGDYNKHNCCFFIQTELGQLSLFAKSLPKLKSSELGRKVMLNESWYN